MNSKEIKIALKEKRHICGNALVSTSPVFLDAEKRATVDFVFIDTEHTPQNRFEIAWMCKAYSVSNIAAIVRIPSPDPYLACMTLDGFADGVMVPYVETVQQVKKLVGAVKYRPLKGEMLERALNGEKLPTDVEKFLEERNFDKTLWINIESQKGIDNLPEMLKFGGIDAVIIGPHDLSISLGTPENYYSEQFLAGIKKIVEIAKEHGVSVGCHNRLDRKTRFSYLDMGMNISLYSSDVSAFSEKLNEEFTSMRKYVCDGLST